MLLFLYKIENLESADVDVNVHDKDEENDDDIIEIKSIKLT